MIHVDAVRDVFEQRRLSRFRRSDDQAALTFSERSEEIEDARGEAHRLGLEFETLVGASK